jgi:hypothetical protein
MHNRTLTMFLVLACLVGPSHPKALSAFGRAEGAGEGLTAYRPGTATVVIGMAAGKADSYGVGLYANFVGSLRKTGYCGDIVLGVSSELPEDAKAYLTSMGVDMRLITSGPCAAEPGEVSHHLCAPDDPDVPMALYRFKWYLDTVKEYRRTAKVMLADTRDVFFQTDPFTHKGIDWDDGQHTFFPIMEHSNITIKMQGVNYGWIENCFGKDEAERVAYDNAVSCSGTTLGTAEGITKYLELMWTTMREKNCKYFGIDQVRRPGVRARLRAVRGGLSKDPAPRHGGRLRRGVLFCSTT